MNLRAPTLEILSKKFFSASILHILAKSLSNILMLHKLSPGKTRENTRRWWNPPRTGLPRHGSQVMVKNIKKTWQISQSVVKDTWLVWMMKPGPEEIQARFPVVIATSSFSLPVLLRKTPASKYFHCVRKGNCRHPARRRRRAATRALLTICRAPAGAVAGTVTHFNPLPSHL